ncbi:MBL fold metallo-hydrolase, partial [bacterium]|nr:MBL fold metallo-hydrolase [bacterium]
MFRTSRDTPRPWWKRHRRRLEHLIVTAILLAVASALYASESRRIENQGQLRVWFFDVGQGDATLIETPDGHQILVDGGPDDTVLTKLGEVLGPLDRSLDLVLATHPDADHIGGLASVIRDYDVADIDTNGDQKFTSTMRNFESASDEEAGANHVIVRAGDAWQFGDVSIRAVWPRDDKDVAAEDANYSAVVLLVTYGDTNFLLTGDATTDAEAIYDADVPDIDVLKAGHHGSAGSSS